MSEPCNLWGLPRQSPPKPRVLTAQQQDLLFRKLEPELGVRRATWVARACAYGMSQLTIRHRRDDLGITVFETITIDHNILCQTVSDSSIDCLVSGRASGPIEGVGVLVRGVTGPDRGG